MHTKSIPKVLPSGDYDLSLAERFSDFFTDKIQSIKNVFKDSSKTDVSISMLDSCNSSFPEFSPVSEDILSEL